MSDTQRTDVAKRIRHNLTSQEFGTILAALRHWQKTSVRYRRRNVFATNFDMFDPLDDDEIDRLCEGLNTSRNRRSDKINGE